MDRHEGEDKATPETPAPIEAAPERAMTTGGWLDKASPAGDYYQQRHQRVDVSIWALLLSWCAPAGITLGIISIVKGARRPGNRATLAWGIVAIVVSVVLPIILWQMAGRSTLEVGDRFETAQSASVFVPQGSQLLSDDEYGLLMNLSRDPDEGVYGMYIVAPSGESMTPEDIEAALSDEAHSLHAYWRYQLFDRNNLAVESVDSVHLDDETVEVVLTVDGAIVVAAVHQGDPSETLFVQYLSGPRATGLGLQLTFQHILGGKGSGDAAVWRRLVESFDYRPVDYDYDYDLHRRYDEPYDYEERTL